jgi:hypothetical protein
MAAVPDAPASMHRSLKRGVSHVSYCSLLWCLWCLQCAPRVTYTPDPEKDVSAWVQTFSQQRSFAYRYTLKTQAVLAEASGECVIGLGEHISGVWRGDTTVHFEYVGLGDREWSWQDDAWHDRIRGEQSDFFTQITRVLEFDSFEYRGFDSGYVYDFKATVPFLSPGGWKEIRGILRISDRTFLPDDVWVGLPDSSVFWHMELSHYNERTSIEAPVATSVQYELQGVSAEHERAVDRRLTLLGIEHHVRNHDGAVVLTVPQYYTADYVQTVFDEKHVLVYEVVPSQQQARKVGYEHGDESKPVYLADTFASVEDIKDIRIRFDSRSRPFLDIQLKEKREAPSRIGCEVNGGLIGVTTLDTHGKIDRIRLYAHMSYSDLQIMRAALLKPLPCVQIRTVRGDSN